MGCNVKEKSIRSTRKHRCSSAKPPPPDHLTAPGVNLTHDPINPNPNLHLPNPNPNPNPNPSSFDGAGWGYCTEEQLEELLLKNLDFVYKEALNQLVAMGYDETLALRAILGNGHCYGSMDVLNNILHNAVTYIKAGEGAGGVDPIVGVSAAFSDLRHLQEYSLAGLVCLLQQVRPHLTRGDAMWCLLMSELHIARATSIEIPPAAGPGFCKFHEPKRKIQIPTRRSNGICGRDVSYSNLENEEKESMASLVAESDVVASVLKSLESMSIEDEKPEEQKKEKVLSLTQKIRDLEWQVKERKEWAQQKAMQAAKKLSNDLTELKVLRMEREENLRVKKGKQTLEDTMMKRLSEMETALKKASGQVDRANTVVARLNTENAEIRAEMEASKLSASESVTTCLEVARREKKCLKRLLAWEKQREKLQKEVVEERRRIEELQQQLGEVREAQKEVEVKWRQEIKAKEQAISSVEEERRAKEAADASIKRNQEVLRRKIEVDFQLHKDDIHRLEEELSRRRASTVSVQPAKPFLNALSSGDSDMAKLAKEINAKIVQGSNKPQNLPRKDRNRVCVICMKEEVNVVLLPCAHQILCVGCSEDQEREAKGNCPCCNAQIDHRIRVYGASC